MLNKLSGHKYYKMFNSHNRKMNRNKTNRYDMNYHERNGNKTNNWTTVRNKHSNMKYNNHSMKHVTNPSCMPIKLANQFDILNNMSEDSREENCVTHNYDIYDSNKISVSIAGFSSTALLDSGSTLSTINRDTFDKIDKVVKLNVKSNSGRKCILADGREIHLNKTVTLPMKLGTYTIDAELHIIDVKHINIIIGCDLLQKLNAKIDFKNSKFITEVKHNVIIRQKSKKRSEISFIDTQNYSHMEAMNHPSKHTQSYQVTQQYNHAYDNSHFIQLKPKVSSIDLSKSDMTYDEKQQMTQLLNEYSDIFAENLTNIGRTHLLEYDLEVSDNAKPIRIQQYKYIIIVLYKSIIII